MLSRLSPLVAVILAATPLASHAAVVDLSALSETLAPVQSVPELTITSDVAGAPIAVGASEIDGEVKFIFCALSLSCANDFTITFTEVSDNVKLKLGDLFPLLELPESDLVTISAFDATNALLTSVDVSSADVFATTPDVNGLYSFQVDLSGVFNVASLKIDDQGTPLTGGYFYYDIEASPIPLPEALPLLALGLGALVALRQRRRKAA